MKSSLYILELLTVEQEIINGENHPWKVETGSVKVISS